MTLTSWTQYCEYLRDHKNDVGFKGKSVNGSNIKSLEANIKSGNITGDRLNIYNKIMGTKPEDIESKSKTPSEMSKNELMDFLKFNKRKFLPNATKEELVELAQKVN